MMKWRKWKFIFENNWWVGSFVSALFGYNNLNRWEAEKKIINEGKVKKSRHWNCGGSQIINFHLFDSVKWKLLTGNLYSTIYWWRNCNIDGVSCLWRSGSGVNVYSSFPERKWISDGVVFEANLPIEKIDWYFEKTNHVHPMQ